MLSRRAFLRTSLQTSTLVALAPTVPSFLARTVHVAQPERDGRLLVVIQLDGGNDGINTVVPFADEGYAKHRKVLRLPTDRLLKINKDVGLHPAMGDAAKLLESGRLAIVQGVSYPNPSRSHFQSMHIWQSARVELTRTKNDMELEEQKALYGWIGQALDEGPRPADGSPGAIFVGNTTPPLAFRSHRSMTSTMTRPEDSVLTLPGEAQLGSSEREDGTDLAAFVRRSTLDAYATSARMAEVLHVKDTGVRYPATGLAGRLQIIARLIKGGVASRIFYTNQGADAGNGGYDTHFVQLPIHADLLAELSGALKAFLDDLSAAKLADRVVALCFSEFGRRVQENGSQGTDHGTAGPIFLAGTKVKAGLVGEAPKLLDLQDGDLKMTTDFRRVYAGVLRDWLGLSSRSALGGDFEPLSLFHG